MRGPRLSVLLVLLATALLVLAIGAVSLSAARLLGHIAEEEALATARVAASSIVEGLQREQDRLVTTADLLAERLALSRLLDTGDHAALAAFLDNFRATQAALGLTAADLRALGRNAVEASFLEPPARQRLLADLDVVPDPT